jgi:hypothetical protein
VRKPFLLPTERFLNNFLPVPGMDTIMVDSRTRDELNELMEQLGYDSLDLLLTDILSFVENRMEEFAAEFMPRAAVGEEAIEE